MVNPSWARSRFLFVSRCLGTTLVVFTLTPVLPAAAPPRSFELERVGGGLRLPTDMADAGNGALLIAEKRGQIVWFEAGAVTDTFLDIRDRVRVAGFDAGEQGLLSFALHPDFASNGRFFVTYTGNDGDSVVARFERSAGARAVDVESERILLRVPQPGDNHNVDVLRFGPDGFLYIGAGDGGFLVEPRCTAQDGDSWLGKLLRIDVDRNVDTAPFYAIPSSNPFAGADAIRDEIWAFGLRNPWRISFDRLTGDLYIGDPGQGGGSAREEIDIEPAFSGGGRNYGWKMVEGNRCRGSSAGCGRALPPCGSSAYTRPALDYSHGSGRCAVVGGHVYRGASIQGLDGVYVFGDYCGQLWAAPADGAAPIAMEPALPELTTFGEDARSELYALTQDGTLYRLVDANLSDAMSDEVRFLRSTRSVGEGGGTIEIEIERVGNGDGNIVADVDVRGGTAEPQTDFNPPAATLSWGDGELGVKTVSLALIDDATIETAETILLGLEAVSDNVAIGDPGVLELTIVDDDSVTTCIPNGETLCLQGSRFAVQVFWRTMQPREGLGTAVPITADGGWYWFFRPGNPEVFVKVLNGCTVNGFFWVFAGGMTDVETRLTVLDTATGAIETYGSGQAEAFGTIRDTRAFDSCP